MAKIFLSFNVVTTSDIIIVVRETADPLSEVARQFYAAPHTQRNKTFDNLNPVMHMVQIWTTVDGTTLLQLKGQCDIDASLTNDVAMEIIQFIVDRGQTGDPTYDPVNNDTQYVNPNLDGKTYTVFKPGYGPLIWGLMIDTITGGGFEYIDGQSFTSGEEYTVLVFNKITTSNNTSGGSFLTDTIELTVDDDFDTNYYKKEILVNSANPLVTLTITDINTIPNGTVFGINTHNGTQRYAVLQLPVGVTVKALGVNRNVLYFGKGENAAFIKKSGTIHILYWDGDVRRVGERIKKDGTAPLNSLPETGGWFLQTDYPRLFNYYVNELPMGDLGSGTDDVEPGQTQRTKWIIGTTKFWVPDRGGYFDRNVALNDDVDTGGVRVSGDVELDLVGPHTHPSISNFLTGAHSAASSALTGIIRFLVNTFASGGSVNSTVNTMQIDANSGTGSGLETRPRNTATNVYRII